MVEDRREEERISVFSPKSIEEERNLPPVKVCKCNVLHRIDIHLHVAVDPLPPSRELCKSQIPPSIAALQQLAGTIER